MCLHLRTRSYVTLNTSKVFWYVTASLFSWLIASIFIFTPSYSSLLPPQPISFQTLKEKDHFLLIRGQAEDLAEEGSPTRHKYKSKTWQ